MPNLRIKKTLSANHMKQWQLADLLHIREESLSRILRYELPEEKQDEIISLIENHSPASMSFKPCHDSIELLIDKLYASSELTDTEKEEIAHCLRCSGE